jgi:pyruvate,water dikinase
MPDGALVEPLRGALAAERVGGKASALAAAAAAGLPVPWGFAVTTVGMAALAEPMLAAAVEEELEHGEQGRFAVRSSAVDEDSAEMSAAGVFQTFLGVPPAGVLEALRQVADSALSQSAISYRAKREVDEPVRMAAVVQSMVLADAAGVAFSRDPVTGEPGFVIESVWGLGEPIVSGTMTPDRFVLADAAAEPTVTTARKATQLRLGDRAVEKVPVDTARRDRPSLDSSSAQAVATLAAECERLGGRPCEVEWAQRDEQIFLLQFRPLTDASIARVSRSML